MATQRNTEEDCGNINEPKWPRINQKQKKIEGHNRYHSSILMERQHSFLYCIRS